MHKNEAHRWSYADLNGVLCVRAQNVCTTAVFVSCTTRVFVSCATKRARRSVSGGRRSSGGKVRGMAIVNRTPHPIRILDLRPPHAPLLELPAATGRDLVRVAVTATKCRTLAGAGQAVPVCSQVWGAIENLPAPARGVFHVVSCVVAAAACCNGRGAGDLLVPGELVRDKAGNIVGAAGLVWADASLPYLNRHEGTMSRGRTIAERAKYADHHEKYETSAIVRYTARDGVQVRHSSGEWYSAPVLETECMHRQRAAGAVVEGQPYRLAIVVVSSARAS